MVWDEEKVSKLKELWGKGNTATKLLNYWVWQKCHIEKHID